VLHLLLLPSLKYLRTNLLLVGLGSLLLSPLRLPLASL
jgi:hypothetical protein